MVPSFMLGSAPAVKPLPSAFTALISPSTPNALPFALCVGCSAIGRGVRPKVGVTATVLVRLLEQAPLNGAVADEALGGVNGLTAASIELKQPITVTGTAMGLVLDLQVSATAPFNGACSSSLTNTVAVTPTFGLTPLPIAEEPTNSANGKAAGVEGLISAVNADGSRFTAGALPSMNEGTIAPAWQVAVSGGTVFQGVTSPSGLTVGMPVDIDLVIQPD